MTNSHFQQKGVMVRITRKVNLSLFAILLFVIVSAICPGVLPLCAWAQGTGSLSAKPFTAWTAEEIKLVRTLSPWSRPSAIMQTRDVPSTRRPPSEKIAFNIPVTLRWESALTMRRAAARAQAMRENLSAADTEGLLEAEPPHYVLEVARRGDALNFPVFYSVTDEERQAWTRCTLQTSKRKLLPTEVSIKGEKREVVRVLFPRTVEGQPAITANDEAVTLACKDPWVTINVKFDLKIMALDGKPDL